MTTNLQEPQEFTGVEWVVDLQAEPPTRLVKIEFDTPTLIALVDVADAASYFGGERTRENAVLFRDYVLPIIRELESRSLVDYDQWVATKHFAEDEPTHKGWDRAHFDSAGCDGSLHAVGDCLADVSAASE